MNIGVYIYTVSNVCFKNYKASSFYALQMLPNLYPISLKKPQQQWVLYQRHQKTSPAILYVFRKEKSFHSEVSLRITPMAKLFIATVCLKFYVFLCVYIRTSTIFLYSNVCNHIQKQYEFLSTAVACTHIPLLTRIYTSAELLLNSLWLYLFT